MADGGLLQRVWRWLKVSRKLELGPARLLYRFERAVPWRRRSLRLPSALSSAAPSSGFARTVYEHYERPARDSARQPVADAAPRPRLPKRKDARGQLALIVGAGPGLGVSLAYTLAGHGMKVALASRNQERLEILAKRLRQMGNTSVAYACDATDETEVLALFKAVQQDLGTPHLVVYALQSFARAETMQVEAAAFERSWRHNCLGAFLVAREAARAMVPQARGTIILVGSTSSLIGREEHLNLAVGKFGQRALAQVLARELWAKGVHVGHVVIDADIREGAPAGVPQSEPHDVAQAILNMHLQPRSAWTSELDLRPWNEAFWKHC